MRTVTDDTITSDLTMLQSTLKDLAREGILNVPQMARLTGIDDSTFYRWMSGNREPSFTTFLRVFRAGGSELQKPLLDLLTFDTPWTCYSARDFDSLDVDHNGKVDVHDALQSLSQAIACAGQDVGEVNEAMRDGKLSDDEQQRIDRQITETIRQLLTARAIMSHIHQEQSAKPARHQARRSGGAA